MVQCTIRTASVRMARVKTVASFVTASCSACTTCVAQRHALSAHLTATPFSFLPIPQQGGGAGTSGGHTTSTATAAFVPLVIRCASNPHFLARVASSRALAALVPPVQAPEVITQLLGKLPKNEAEARSRGAGAHNHMHGEQRGTPSLLLVVLN